ncbi:hypothetical protein L9F63_005754 [Diploptera punctata]|uniref:Regulatory protein zeste n=1 Tax=Diploptera punctata TaxID=6984 RepID=A0AAD7ZBV9_DIPPU|nr:hypothetical protein L9F63_005754 [Diploptera punctata]
MEIFSDKRTPPLRRIEKQYLIQLVNKYRQTVENKQINVVSIRQKTEGWELISREFSSMPNVSQRSGNQLRKCWSNMKQRSKKEKIKTWKHARSTRGGGPSSPPDRLQKMDTVFDCDGFGAETISSEESGNFISFYSFTNF